MELPSASIRQLYINGSFVPSIATAPSQLPAINPATGAEFALLTDASTADVDAAVAAARASF